MRCSSAELQQRTDLRCREMFVPAKDGLAVSSGWILRNSSSPKEWSALAQLSRGRGVTNPEVLQNMGMQSVSTVR